MNVLDTIVGPANWHDEFEVVDRIVRDDGTARITVECRLTVLGVTKADAGYGEIELSNDGKKLFGNYDKEAYSIALKRAAVKFGIARDLYRDGMPIYEASGPDPADYETDPEDAHSTGKPTRPYDAETFLNGVRIRLDNNTIALTGVGPTEKQTGYLASIMGDAFQGSPTAKKDRLAVLSLITGEEIGSTKEVDSALARFLLDAWVDPDTKGLSEIGAAEIQNLYRAAMIDQGQIDMFDTLPGRPPND
jgi:hypothetical protein